MKFRVHVLAVTVLLLMNVYLASAQNIAFAQNNLPPVYEIKSDTGSYQNLERYHWQILEDRSGKLTIENVSKPPFTGRFHAYDSAKGIDFSIRTYWLRYILKNSMNHDIRISIGSYISYVDIYTTDSSGKWDHKKTGILVPWSKRDGFKSILYVPFTIKPGEELIIYQRENYNYIYSRPTGFYIGFSFTDKLIEQNYINNDSQYFSVVFNSIQLGIIIIAFFFNLMFYKVVREKVYLFFSLFLFLLGIQGINYGISNVLFREHPALAYNVYVLAVLFFFFMIHFFRYFFKTFQYYPGWDKFLFVFGFILVINCIVFVYLLPFTSLSAISYVKINMLMASAFSLCMLFILITILLFVRNRDKTINLKVIAALPIFIYWGIYDSYNQLRTVIYTFYGKQMPQMTWVDQWSNIINTICFTWLIVMFSWILFQRYQKLRKDLANEALDKERLAKEKETERALSIEQQKIELEKTVGERTAELKQSLHELKSTQAQLIQQEKMASLGELTAGIAHEIQNPLNFVNNFSEVNKEMIDELKAELAIGNQQQAMEIADDIKDNEQKINHHGKRADAIVKNMLQHSRQTKGVKEPTDINALCDEYLRLAYHGMRAKDKNFNADFKTDFDQAIGKIDIVPQDIGRVLLNLFNNAFYAVNEKKKNADENYKLLVSVQTKKINNKIEIRISDNGNGIPQKIIDKIFQPFFTTKPTGEGTGLGLSLAYDIIKAHGGDVKVETKEGEGSVFIIQLPLTKTL